MKVSKFRSPIGPSSLKKILNRSNQTRISEKAGQPPGTIIYTGAPKEGETDIALYTYDQENINVFETTSLDEISSKIVAGKVNWINFNSLHQVELIAQAGIQFNIHNLTLEDIAHVGHQPKMEEYENYLFMTMKMIKPNQERDEFMVEQISFILTEDHLISFQEQTGDPFDNIRDRLMAGKGKARGRGPDYLLFLLMDAIVDQYLLVIESVNNQISGLEMEVLEDPDEQVVTKIIDQKKTISTLRKIIFPLRDSLKDITTGETDFIAEDYFNYFNDVYDHLKQIVEHLDNQREALTSLMEFYMSRISTQMNKVMQRLTIVATIFIPLTFLAGIYGMNFHYMPELEFKWGYPVLLFIMLSLGVGMYIYMRRKKWF